VSPNPKHLHPIAERHTDGGMDALLKNRLANGIVAQSTTSSASARDLLATTDPFVFMRH